jgi:hypothetical protein
MGDATCAGARQHKLMILLSVYYRLKNGQGKRPVEFPILIRQSLHSACQSRMAVSFQRGLWCGGGFVDLGVFVEDDQAGEQEDQGDRYQGRQRIGDDQRVERKMILVEQFRAEPVGAEQSEIADADHQREAQPLAAGGRRAHRQIH